MNAGKNTIRMIEVPALEIQRVVREWAHPNQEKQHTAQTAVMTAIMKLENKSQMNFKKM